MRCSLHILNVQFQFWHIFISITANTTKVENICLTPKGFLMPQSTLPSLLFLDNRWFVLCHFRLDVSLLTFYINGIMELSCVWLLWFSILFLRFPYVLYSSTMILSVIVEYCAFCGYTVIYLWVFWWILELFIFKFGLLYKAAMKFMYQVSGWTYIFVSLE